MKINFNKTDLAKLDNLFLYKEMNIASNEAIYQFFFENLHHKDFLTWLGVTPSDKENKMFLETYFNNPFKKLDISYYENDKYAKLLSGIRFKNSGYSLDYLTLKEGSLIPFNDIDVINKPYYIEHANVGYFEKDFKYLAISKDDVVWMSLDPSEINTMVPVAKLMKGNVLIFGLGLGYFPFLCLENKEVKSITIIEKDKNIIDLYRKFIFPHVKPNIKFDIIEADAYEYIKNTDITKFDSIYCDIWHNANDGFPLYYKFLKALKSYAKPQYFWLEESLLAIFRRLILNVLLEELDGLKDQDFMKVKDDFDEFYKLVHFKFKDKVFNTYEELHNFLSNDNLKTILIDL